MNHSQVRTFDYRIFLINIFSFILTVIALLMPAIQNGFPLLHADSGTYMLQGFATSIPVSRPITYCWFVRYTAFEYSLWFVLITQAVLLASSSLLFIYYSLNSRFASVINLLVVGILSITTGIAFYTSQIVPDFFLAVGLFSLCILITSGKLKWILLTILPIVIVASGVVHLSNLPLLTASLAGAIFFLLLARKFTGYKPRLRQYVIIALTMIIAWLLVPKINSNYGQGFKFSVGSNIVFTSRLFASGAMGEYINDRCEEDSTFYLCRYVNELEEYKRFDYFLWRDTSMLYEHECMKRGWDRCWRERDAEFGALNKDLLSHSKYRNIFYRDVVRQFFKQLVTFNIIGYPSFLANQNMHYPIQKNFKNDYPHFKAAHQQGTNLSFPILNKIQIYMVILSLLIIILFYSFRNLRVNIPLPLSSLLVMLVITVLVNALMIGYLAVVVGRFEGRMIWLFPYLALLLVIQYFRQNAGFRFPSSPIEKET